MFFKLINVILLRAVHEGFELERIHKYDASYSNYGIINVIGLRLDCG